MLFFPIFLLLSLLFHFLKPFLTPKFPNTNPILLDLQKNKNKRKRYHLYVLFGSVWNRPLVYVPEPFCLWLCKWRFVPIWPWLWLWDDDAWVLLRRSGFVLVWVYAFVLWFLVSAGFVDCVRCGWAICCATFGPPTCVFAGFNL